MDPAAVAGLCALLARGEAQQPLPAGVSCPPAAVGQLPPGRSPIPAAQRARITSDDARDAIARVAFAEAGNQGDSGLAAVVYTILNRLADGRWGDTVDSVLNARGQFEPVMRAGGDWRRLAPATAAGQARIDTILNLAIEGRLPDLTNGARYFQNPVIVADRVRDGQVSPWLVNFGGQTPSAVIGAHSFYTGGRGAGGSLTRATTSAPPHPGALMFVGENRVANAAGSDADPASTAPPPDATGARSGDPSRALFVTRDGRISADPP